MSTYRAADLASAAGIGTRTKWFILREPDGYAYEDQGRFNNVTAALCRADITPDLDARVHTVAYALRKSVLTSRMNPVSALRIQTYTPYQICKLVAQIANDCPETTTGGICDDWLAQHHEEL